MDVKFDPYFAWLATTLVFFIILVAGLVRQAALNYGISGLFYIPYPAAVLVLGFGCGFITFTNATLDRLGDYLERVQKIPGFHLFLPAYIFKTVYTIDWQDLRKCWKQVILLGVFAFFGMSTLTGMILVYMCDSPFDYFSKVLLYGAVLNAVDVGYLLDGFTRLKQLRTLFEGEAILNAALAMLIYTENQHYFSRKLFWQPESNSNLVNNHYSSIMLLLINAGVAVATGAIYLLVIAERKCDYSTHFTTSVAFGYLLFAFMEHYFSYGIVALIGFALMSCAYKSSNSCKASLALVKSWSTLLLLANLVVFTTAGIVAARRLTPLDIWQSIGNILLLYVSILFSRLIIILLSLPLLKLTGFGFCWRRAVVLIWSSVRSTLSLGLILCMNNEDYQNKFHVYGIGMVFLNQIINGTTTRALMLGLGLLAPASVSSYDKVLMQLEEEKNVASRILHTNVVFADCQWASVEETTMLRRTKFEREHSLELEFLGMRYRQCDDCQRVVPERLKDPELLELEIVARRKILKAQKISYTRQHAQELLSTNAYRVLSAAVEEAYYDRLPVIKVNNLRRYWQMDTFQAKLYNWLVKERSHWFITLVNGVSWDLFILLTVLLHFTSTVWAVIDGNWQSHNIVMSSAAFIYLICLQFLAELLVFGVTDKIKLSYIILDFLILTLCFGHLYAYLAGASDTLILFLNISKIFRVLRLLSIFELIQKLFPYIARWLNAIICNRLLLGYDVGKGYVIGNEETLKLLPRLVYNAAALKSLQEELENDRKAVYREIEVLQLLWPIPVSTLKTKQCALSLVRRMEVRAGELSIAGLLDEEEESHLLKELADQRRRVYDELLAVLPNSAQEVLFQIPWLRGNPQSAATLASQTVTKSLNPGSIILRSGDNPKGLLLVCSGFVRCHYRPSQEQIDAMLRRGQLPNFDLPRHLNYSEEQVEYLWEGSVIGEIGVLTNRNHNITLTCETNAMVAFISNMALLPVLPNLVIPMWRAVGIRIATILLTQEAGYETWTQDRIKASLEQSIAPELADTLWLDLNGLAQHVFLIDGAVADAESAALFTAPCIVSSETQRLILPKSVKIEFPSGVPDTRLLILPLRDESITVSYTPDGGASLDTGFKWCPLHDPSSFLPHSEV